MNMADNNKFPERPRLCYISVIAFVFSLLICFIPSSPRDLIPLNVFAFAIAMLSLLRIKFSNGRLRGKGVVFAAVVANLACVLVPFLV